MKPAAAKSIASPPAPVSPGGTTAVEVPLHVVAAAVDAVEGIAAAPSSAILGGAIFHAAILGSERASPLGSRREVAAVAFGQRWPYFSRSPGVR